MIIVFGFTIAMIIGFTERVHTVSESMVEPGADWATFIIDVATLRTAEREHWMIFRLQVSDSTVIVQPHYDITSIYVDASFGTRDSPDDPVEELDFLEPLADKISSVQYQSVGRRSM